MLKKLFNQKSPDPRYVDIHGFKWQGGFAELLRTPDMKIGTVFCAAASAVDLATGQGNAAMTMFTGVGLCLFSKGLSVKITHEYLDQRKMYKDFVCAEDYAIDREGKSPHPECIDVLMHQCKTLARLNLGAACFFGLIFATVVRGELKDIFDNLNNGQIPNGGTLVDAFVFALPFLATADTAIRTRKILNGEYSFCGKPPKVDVREAKAAKVPANANAVGVKYKHV